jgi:hypothetical protein
MKKRKQMKQEIEFTSGSKISTKKEKQYSKEENQITKITGLRTEHVRTE